VVSCSNPEMKIYCITNQRAGLGESPVWSKEENCVYWIDILGPSLLCTDLATQRTRVWKMPNPIGMIALRTRGGLIVALEDGIYSFDASRGNLELLTHLEEACFENRPNDGKCDVKGRLWVGTMNKVDSSQATGAFYRIAPSLTIDKINCGIRIPNGLAWSPDDSVMYHTDTRSNMVYSYNFNSANGERSEKKEFFSFGQNKNGSVDGAAMDIEGGYWAALYGGGKLVRIMPDGAVEREIPLPVTQPTMPAFGGMDMKTIFITTARQKLNADTLVSQDFAGGLLSLQVDVPGLPVHPFGG
jgi:sugar lactone lactonase YvrE